MSTQDQIAALSNDKGFTDRLYNGDTEAIKQWSDLNRQLAAENTAAGTLADTATGENVTEAREQIAKLSADKEFVAKLQARDPEAMQDWKDLHEIAASGVPGSRGRGSLVR